MEIMIYPCILVIPVRYRFFQLSVDQLSLNYIHRLQTLPQIIIKQSNPCMFNSFIIYTPDRTQQCIYNVPTFNNSCVYIISARLYYIDLVFFSINLIHAIFYTARGLCIYITCRLQKHYDLLLVSESRVIIIF